MNDRGLQGGVGLNDEVAASCHIEESLQSIRIEIDADAAVSYASHQNSVPLIHSITVLNETVDPAREVEVVIEVDPAFAEPMRFRYDRLEAGESRVIRPVDLRMSHAYLAALNEAEKGRARVDVRVEGVSRAIAETEVSVLAYDQWGGTQTVPELLCAFSVPNHPHVDRIMAEAADLLEATRRGFTMNGYTDKNREAVWAQLSAIYAAIARRGLNYSLPPASFATSGQKVRMPDRIFEGGVGTCLDLALLLSSALEQAGLNPVLLLKDRHIWIGCWLVYTSFPTCVVDDGLAVRKRIDAGEMIAIEATLLAQRGATFKMAQDYGLRHFIDTPKEFNLAIDVRRARLERILPISARDVAPLSDREGVERDVEVDVHPVLPPLTGESVLIEDEAVVETPAGRLGRWTSKLLDLTLRNRLLNFKPSKVMVQLQVPDMGALEDALADGLEWKFRALPQIMEGRDPRSRKTAIERTGVDPVESMAKEAMAQRELLAMVEQGKLNQQLNEIYLTVRTGLEETGANTLYLVLGFLRWAEDERAESTHLAPLLLVPVTLKRASVRAGFSLVRHDDETIVNPTLLQALDDRYGVKVRGVDPPPMDEHGVDVPKVLAIFREAVKEIDRWEVVPEVYLGVFSFHKFVMYTDLKKRQEALRRSRIVQHLLDRPNEALDNKDLNRRDDLDDACPPGAIMAPMSADSSQINCLRRVQEGNDLVMEGPPGTGKSQTITNLIVDAMSRGQRVLFVSEKMAALTVVERRLRALGLGAFCLELHSAKATKSEVLDRLKTSMAIVDERAPAAWELEIERLARLRNELNSVVSALHAEHSNGLTVYQATGTAIRHREWRHIPVASIEGRPADTRALERMREFARKMQAVASQIGTLRGNALRSIARIEWSNRWEDEIVSAGARLKEAIALLRDRMAELATPLGLHLDLASMQDLASLDALGEVMLQAPSVPAPFAELADDASMRRQVAMLREHGLKRNAAWGRMEALVKPDVARLRGIELRDAWVIAGSKWALPRWFGRRAVRTRLIPYTLNGKAPTTEAADQIISALVDLNAEDEALKGLSATGAKLLAEEFRETETDWSSVARFEAWGTSLETLLDRFASIDDPQVRSGLAAKVKDLVGPNRRLLAPTGAMAQRIAAYRAAYLRFAETLKAASDLSGNSAMAGESPATPGALSTLEAAASSWSIQRGHLRDWCQWNGFRAEAGAFGLAGVFTAIEAGAVPPAQIADYVEYCYRVTWLKEVMDRDELLRTFSGAVHEQRIQDFRDADEKFQELTKRLVYSRLAGGVSRAKQDLNRKSEVALLSREIQKQTRHIPIRKLAKSIPGLLSSLKPCLLMSPLSVAQYLDPEYPPFDLVVFDEGSQIPVWDAVGVIARGSRVVIAGDPKQLPPTAFFDRADDEEEVDEEALAVPKDLESILDECLSIGMSRISLDWHYRSAHESLIAFSNARYYDSRLLTFPSPATRDTSVMLVPVNGIYDRGGSCTNKAEAEAVVKRIVAHFSQDDAEARKASVGVVTFNMKQQRLIDSLLNAELLKRPELEARMAAHGDERIFIKNLESVQGDEREIILFSTTFGKDSAGRLTANFGPINQTGGERRLNVAITRARRQVEIFSSLRPEDIDLSRTRARGVIDLKAYLDYALRGPAAMAMESAPTNRDPDSPFEREVLNAIRDAGWEVHPQVGVSGYRIDIGVVDKSAPGRYLLGVECDGATYHSMANARDRDRLRQMVLEGLGWRIERVWSTDWWLNRERCVEKLVASIAQAQRVVDEASREAEPVAAG